MPEHLASLEAVRRFLHDATQPEAEAAVGQYISDSPTRDSGTSSCRHWKTGVDIKRVLYNDWEWWSDRADDVNERFSAWLAR